MRDRVEDEAGCLDRAVRAGTAEQRVETGCDLGERERLRHVVVAARVEPGQTVDKRVTRGEEQHRRTDAAGPECLADVAPVGVR